MCMQRTLPDFHDVSNSVNESSEGFLFHLPGIVMPGVKPHGVSEAGGALVKLLQGQVFMT